MIINQYEKIEGFIATHNNNLKQSLSHLIDALPDSSLERSKQSSYLKTFIMAIIEEMIKHDLGGKENKDNYANDKFADIKYRTYLKNAKIITKEELTYFNALSEILNYHENRNIKTSQEEYEFMLKSSLNLITLIISKYNYHTPKDKNNSKVTPTITESQFMRLMNASQKREYRLAYFLSFTAGLNISEITNLRLEDIDIKNRTIYARGDSIRIARIIPLNDSFKEEHIRLLPIKQQQRAIQKKFISDCEKAGLLKENPNLQFRSLRRGYAKNLEEQGKTLYEIKELLGNKRLSATAKLMEEINKTEQKVYKIKI
ncbi:MAG: tyrosine-type recombinase/integrase [Nanoarchaeota archaeon]|jgi:integrase|nr:tyrosine-type recombinase/integrase [Nanoarchaeota archaeon]